jgi:hypothetical protein
MADVTSLIEGYLQTAISTAVAGTSGRCVIGFSENEKLLERPWAQLELEDGEAVVVDAVAYMQETMTAFIAVHGDTRDQVRVALAALKVLYEPLPTTWTGVQLVDIVPGQIQRPRASVSATEEYVGTIELLITFRVSYV